MVCPECGGAWGVRKNRVRCKDCGYLDPRLTWVDNEYYGPPELNPERLTADEYFAEKDRNGRIK